MTQTNVEQVESLLTRLRKQTNLFRGGYLRNYRSAIALTSELGVSLRHWAEATGKRVVVEIPLVHNLVDFGSCQEIVAQSTKVRLSNAQYRKQAKAITAFWDYLVEVTPGLRPDKVYQDGLPVCDQYPTLVAKVVSELPGPNGTLVRVLRDQGAKVVGTEDLPLLLQERERVQSGVVNQGPDGLLARRDAFIADRIIETLGAEVGQVGLLFIGGIHQVRFPAELGIWMVQFPTPLDAEIQKLRKGGQTCQQ